MPILAACAGNIDLWLAFYHDIADEALLSRLRGLLSPTERQQEPRFHFADDRRRYLVTRAMVRTVLSRYAPIKPVDWNFTTNRYGRPEIAGGLGKALGISFNVSHTRGLIALGITRRRALGVDVENVAARRCSTGIASRFFAPAEVVELSRLPAAQQQERFFEYWVLKEAYIKARGMGLSLPLDQFSFSFPDEHTVQIAIQRALGDDAKRWSLWQYRPTPESLLAICAERLGVATPTITVRKVIPTQSEQLLYLRALKTSESVAARALEPPIAAWET